MPKYENSSNDLAHHPLEHFKTRPFSRFTIHECRNGIINIVFRNEKSLQENFPIINICVCIRALASSKVPVLIKHVNAMVDVL